MLHYINFYYFFYFKLVFNFIDFKGRKHHGCAKVWKDSYSLKYSIVVVGGENKDFIPTVEVLDEDGSTWRQGPSLPFGISRSVLLEDPRCNN